MMGGIIIYLRVDRFTVALFSTIPTGPKEYFNLGTYTYYLIVWQGVFKCHAHIIVSADQQSPTMSLDDRLANR